MKSGEYLSKWWGNTEKTPAGCWVWQGSKNSSGYPYARYKGAMRGVHRMVYFLSGRPLMPGEAVHHKCGTKLCINPEHLEAATAADNTLEMLARTAYLSRIDALEEAVRDIGAAVNEALRRLESTP